MLRLGLLLLGAGLAVGFRSWLGRLTEPGSTPSGTDFASELEHGWATIGPRVAVALIAAGTVIVLVALIAQRAYLPDPLAGVWDLDPAASITDPGLTLYATYTIEFESTSDGAAQLAEHRVRVDGTKIDFDQVVALDGSERPLGDGATVAYERMASDSYTITNRVRGEPVVVVTRTISADGMSMTHLGVGEIGGRPFRNEFVFRLRS